MGSIALDSRSLFLKEMNMQAPLSASEEFAIAMKYYEEKDEDAAKKLIMSQIKSVHYIASKYRHFGLQEMDLIQEGTIGLMKAVKNFNPKKGFRLTTYASFWIKESIHNFVLNSWSIVKIGTTKLQRKVFAGLKNSQEAIAVLDGTDLDKVAKKYNVSENEYLANAHRFLSRDCSIEFCEKDGFEFSSGALSPEEIFEEKATVQYNSGLIKDAIDTLDDRGRHIIKERHLSEDKTSLKAISLKYSISIERVRQLEKKALQKIKGFILK